MASVDLRPLDDEFVKTFREKLETQTHLFSQEAKAHWTALFNHFEGRSDFEIRAYIAQNFKSHNWRGNEAWFRDGYTQKLFQGYDQNEFVRSNVPALDDEARRHYNPSNTLGRGNLFPALPVIEREGPPVLNREEFWALSSAQRQRYQITSGFGGDRFQRIPNTSTTAGGDTQGLATDITSRTNEPTFDNTITDDPVDNNAGTPGTQQATTTGTNPFGIPTPPTQSGTKDNVQRPSQLGGTFGVTPGFMPPDLPRDMPPGPGTSSVNQQGANISYPPTTTAGLGPNVAGTGFDGVPRYPDLPKDIPSTSSTVPAQPPATIASTETSIFGVPPPPTPGPTPTTVGTTSGTAGTTSGTVGTTSGTTATTPGTAGTKVQGTNQPPSGPGIPPQTTEATPGGTVPVPGGVGVPPMPAWNTSQDTVPPPAPGGIPSGAPGPDGSVPKPLQPSQSDMQHAFTWRGQVQPPVGTRIRQILQYLDEGDVDREMHWETDIAKIREFLEAYERGEITVTGSETALMFQEALQKVQAHNLFNETHYGSNTPNKVVTADMIASPKPRLKYNGKMPLILGRDHKDNEQLQPEDFPTHPRPEMIVNDQWLTDVERQAGLTEEKRSDRQAGLSRDEEEWWRLEPYQTIARDNAALRHEQTFEQCIARDGVGFEGGWIDIRREEDKSLTRKLFNGDRLGDGKDCYARERAARRAGLQAALRQFSSKENRVANTPWRRVRLPLTPKEVAVMRKNTGAGPGRKYEIAKLQPHQLQATDGKSDPQGFTANMAQFWASQNKDMVTARETVLSRLGFGLPVAQGQPRMKPPTVLPPTSLWGAYVDSGLSAEDEYHRQMLKEMRTTRKLFEREMKIAPRNFLADMNTLYQQGFNGFDDTYAPRRGGPSRNAQVLDARDLVRSRGNVLARDLDKMEIYWIRFLLNQSITPAMTQELEPRASLFVLFADKLARIFNDVSDPLFPDNKTRVSVEDLLDYIHERADGPVQRIKFYAHDVQMWLERLHSQGRCRYQEDWRCYGWVMRPVPSCHPEHLVRWTFPDETWRLRPDQRNEDLVLVPRFDRLRNWQSVVKRGLQNSPLDQRVEDFFLVLAYRWGVYMAKLTGDDGLEQQWKTQAPRRSNEMSWAIADYKAEFDRITQWENPPNNPLVKLVKATLNDKANDNSLTAEASLKLIRDNIITEAVKNDSVLWPARSAKSYLDPLDEKVRPKVWGWARPEVRGKVKRFFSVNRWPVQLQTQKRQDIITRDTDIDTDMLWKPELEDPTPSKYYRPKARPYVEEKVQFRAGHRNFLIGDTPHQKQVVIDRMFAQMGRAMMTKIPKNAVLGGNDQDKKDGEQDQGRQDGNQDQGRQDDGQGQGRQDDGQGQEGQGQEGQGQEGEGQEGQGQDIDIEPPGFIERWSMYLLSRYEGEDPDRYQEPGAKLRKFRPGDIPRSEDPRARKRPADDDDDDDAPAQGNPKRPRQRGPGAREDQPRDGEGGADDAQAGDVGQPPRARGTPARGTPARGTPAGPQPGASPAGVPAAGAPGQGAQVAAAQEAEAQDEEAAGEGENRENDWWDIASLAMSI